MRPALAERLRAATHEAHRAVDQAVALTGPVVSDDALIHMFRMLEPVCAAVERQSAATLPWGPRLPRSAWLRDDLARLGATVHPVDFPLRSSANGWMGWHYVIEGSTLGSAHLTRHLAAVRPDLPSDHYFARNRAAGQRWRGFLKALAEVPAAHEEAVVDAACQVFDALAARSCRPEQVSARPSGEPEDDGGPTTAGNRLHVVKSASI